MRADLRRQIEPGDDGILQVRLGGILRSMDQFVAVEDLDHATLGGAVGCIYAIALGAGGHHAVHVAGRSARRSGLLAGQAEVADEQRLGRVAQVIDLPHPFDFPAGLAGDEKGDAGIALPPVLVRVAEAADNRVDATWSSRIGHVPHFLGAVAVAAQQIHLILVGVRQSAAVAYAHHLCPSGLLP